MKRNWAPALARHPASARCSAIPNPSAALSSTRHSLPKPTRSRTPPPAGFPETITTPTSITAIPFIKIDEGYARLPGAGYEALHPELKDVDPEDYPDIHKMSILADVAPYSREIGRAHV